MSRARKGADFMGRRAQRQTIVAAKKKRNSKSCAESTKGGGWRRQKPAGHCMPVTGSHYEPDHAAMQCGKCETVLPLADIDPISFNTLFIRIFTGYLRQTIKV
jgi:hypothetical protein